jgi:N-acetylmuramic acid 6-phosphate etherase
MVERVPGKINYASLATEQTNPSSRQIDRVSISAALKIIHREDAKIPSIVWRQRAALERGVTLIVAAIRSGGRLVLLGAGTSGRLAVLEAAECPPTFNTPPSLIQAFMAGGRSSVFRSKEGAEDRGSDAVRVVRSHVRPGDVVVGIAASGVTAYVRDGLRAARERRARTIFVTCNPRYPKGLADVTIAVNTGPEVITGSTRLKAGTATKLVLNMLTVVSMAQLGKVYGNRMVDLQPRSRKLEARAIGLIKLLGGVSERDAVRLLASSGKNAKTAIVMAKRNVSRAEAVRALKAAKGLLHKALKG